MLMELKVSQFAIIDNIHLQFRNGLNILSGETGAGKSVLLKSLALLMGAKASTDTIRSGATQAVVEGLFDLKDRPDVLAKMAELGIETDAQQLLVRRIVSSDDRSRIYLNSSLSQLSQLKELVAPLVEVTGAAAPLIEMTGQHDNRNLLSKNYHLDVVDVFSDSWDLRKEFEAVWKTHRELKNKMAEYDLEKMKHEQRLDYLKFQRAEIEKLDLKPGEEFEIENQLKLMKSTAKLAQYIESIESILENDEGSAISRIQAVIKKSQDIVQIRPEYAKTVENLTQAESQIADFIYATRKSFSTIELDPDEVQTLEERLSQIRKIQKKFGSDINAILSSLVDIETEIAALEKLESDRSKWDSELKTLENKLNIWAKDLLTARKAGALKLAARISAELLDLNMKGVQFAVKVEKTAELTLSGGSEVEFQIQNGPNDTLRPLSKFASGGELSRILLSLKKVVGKSTQPRTFLFDEVDTGVSGMTAEKVGKKLRSIAKGQQVICVTHLPQVAAYGNFHFLIHKAQSKKQIHMDVNELNGEQRIKEIARLISGEVISKTSLAHAKELLDQAEQSKITKTTKKRTVEMNA